jgi:hypothetical protein
MKVVLVSPLPIYGGSLVIFELCELLRERNVDARVYLYDKMKITRKRNPLIKFLLFVYNCFFNTLFNIRIRLRFALERGHLVKESYWPIKTRLKLFPFFSKSTVVLYPDVIYGNPLYATKVVRWLLSKNRFGKDAGAYGKNDLFFSYREFFNDYSLNPTCRLLTISYFDKKLYRQTNFGERTSVCYIIRKGRNRADLPKVFDGPVIDRLPEKEKVEVFNQSKYCYDYDTQTFYSNIASVCGCIPIIMMEPGKRKEDYLGDGDVDYGRAYGDSAEEIEYATRTRRQLIDHLDFTKENRSNADYFVSEVRRHFYPR